MDSSEIGSYFSSWERIQDIAIGAAFFYLYVVALTRILGKRITSQMNNFDWIITVMVGSLAASGILLDSVSIADSAIAIAIVAAFQWATTWLVMRFERFERIVKAQPRLLTHKGALLTEAMKAERISEGEIFSKLRASGLTRLEEANWVILETDGTMTVIPRSDASWEDAQLMQNVNGKPGAEEWDDRSIDHPPKKT